MDLKQLQYRKRYELLQRFLFCVFLAIWVTIPQAVWAVATRMGGCYRWNTSCYNTASGMSCCNSKMYIFNSIAMMPSYNTASGMSCCNPQALFAVLLHDIGSYNTASGMSCCNRDSWVYGVSLWLQYRKRYELLQLGILDILYIYNFYCYNTASGMSCCNE